MRLLKRYRELKALAQALADLGIDEDTQRLERECPHIVLGLLKDRAKRALA